MSSLAGQTASEVYMDIELKILRFRWSISPAKEWKFALDIQRSGCIHKVYTAGITGIRGVDETTHLLGSM